MNKANRNFNRTLMILARWTLKLPTHLELYFYLGLFTNDILLLTYTSVSGPLVTNILCSLWTWSSLVNPSQALMHRLHDGALVINRRIGFRRGHTEWRAFFSLFCIDHEHRMTYEIMLLGKDKKKKWAQVFLYIYIKERLMTVFWNVCFAQYTFRCYPWHWSEIKLFFF